MAHINLYRSSFLSKFTLEIYYAGLTFLLQAPFALKEASRMLVMFIVHAAYAFLCVVICENHGSGSLAALI